MIERDYVNKVEATWLSPTPKGHDCWNKIRFNCDLVHFKDRRNIAFEGRRHRAAGIDCLKGSSYLYALSTMQIVPSSDSAQ